VPGQGGSSRNSKQEERSGNRKKAKPANVYATQRRNARTVERFLSGEIAKEGKRRKEREKRRLRKTTVIQ